MQMTRMCEEYSLRLEGGGGGGDDGRAGLVRSFSLRIDHHLGGILLDGFFIIWRWFVIQHFIVELAWIGNIITGGSSHGIGSIGGMVATTSTGATLASKSASLFEHHPPLVGIEHELRTSAKIVTQNATTTKQCDQCYEQDCRQWENWRRFGFFDNWKRMKLETRIVNKSHT